MNMVVLLYLFEVVDVENTFLMAKRDRSECGSQKVMLIRVVVRRLTGVLSYSAGPSLPEHSF